MDSEQKERIKKDIINHAVESEEVGSGGQFTHDDFEELKDSLENLSESDLESWWFSTVGEWVESMNRWNEGQYHEEQGPLWEVEGFDSVAEWQFDKLLSGEPVDYGYQRYKYSQPY